MTKFEMKETTYKQLNENPNEIYLDPMKLSVLIQRSYPVLYLSDSVFLEGERNGSTSQKLNDVTDTKQSGVGTYQ